MTELERLADEAEREFIAGETLPIEKLCQPTREQRRTDLARAMGWTITTACLLHPSPEICWFSPDGLFKHKNYPPNPYESADDSRALVLWLAKQDEVKWGRFSGFLLDAQMIPELQEIGTWEDVTLAALTAPLPVIADAAWKAIQEKQ